MSQSIRTILSLVLIAVCLAGCGEVVGAAGGQADTIEPTAVIEPKAVIEPTAVTKPTLAAKLPVEQSKAAEETAKQETNQKTWIKTYGGSQTDVVNDVLVAKDGGFFILGATNVDWESWFGAEIYLIRTDRNGEVLWEKSYSGAPFQSGQSIIFTADGNLMIAGTIARDEDTRMDIYLLKVDLEGNELESHIIGEGMDEHVNNIQQTKDGGYLLFGNIVDPNDFVTDPGVAGYGGFENRSSILVMKLDQDGNQVWKTVLDNGENTMCIGGGASKDGGYYVLSTILNFPDLDDDLHLVKLDHTGEEVWSRTWEDARINARDFQVTREGNLLIGAMYSSSGDPREGDADIMLLEINQEGDELWSGIIGAQDEVDILSGVVETKDGGYLMAVDKTADLYNSNSKLTLVKLNEQREVVWEKILDQKPHYMIRNLFELEAGCVIATSFQKTFQSSFDIMLVKTDLDGNLAE